MVLQYIITGLIVAIAVLYMGKKIKNALKGGGCSGNCGCGGNPSQLKKADSTTDCACSRK